MNYFSEISVLFKRSGVFIAPCILITFSLRFTESDFIFPSQFLCLNWPYLSTNGKNLSFEIETKKLKFYEEINQKYTLFKNSYKILRHLLLESNVEFVDDYALSIIFIYGLEKYFSSNKYDNYMVAFVNALDDLINTKKIELQENYINVIPKLSLSSKGYTITDPFDESNNLALNINEANIGELRKFKKKIAKMYEQVTPDTGSSSVLTLNINPLNNSDGTISWRYDVCGRNIQNSGGVFPNTESDSKNASLKAYFRGLKAIVTSNIYNKNITVITKHKDILKCIEKDSSEAENNSRRKTITKYIEDNKLLISYQIKE